jgi:hypothetical protein
LPSSNLDVHQGDELLTTVHVAIAEIALHDRPGNTEFECPGVIAFEE